MLTNIEPKKQIIILYIVLTLAALAVFWQVNQYAFVTFDDNVYITGNHHIRSGVTTDGFFWALGTKYFGLWNPLVWLSFMFDYQLYGLNAGGYHLTNLILHILSTLLLFWLFNRMTGMIWRSAFVAAVFALHPLHVESVAWISERKDTLSAFFWMLTLCLYVYYTEKPNIKKYILVLSCFVLALASKPMVVTLPAIMILLDYWPLGRLQQRAVAPDPNVKPVSNSKGKKKTKNQKEELNKNISPPDDRKLPEKMIADIIPSWQLREKIPFFILSAVISVITLYTPDKRETFSKSFLLWSKIVNAPVAFMTYLEKIFWPYDLSVFYPFSDQIPLWLILASALFIIIISSVIILTVKRLPFLFVGWLWYAVALLPVIGIIKVGNFSMADRYTYLPSIGIAVGLAWGMPLLFPRKDLRKKILFPAGAAIIAFMAVLSWQQCGYWKNSMELFNHALLVTKDNALAHNNIGFAFIAEGRIEEAIGHYDKAISIEKNSADHYNNRGVAYEKSRQYQRAIEDYNEAVRLKPDYAEAYFNRGNVYGELGQYSHAVENYNEAVRLKPDYVEAYNNRGNSYLNQGNTQLGCPDAQKVCTWGDCRLLEIARSKRDCR